MTRPEPFWEKNNNIPNQIVVGTSLKVQIATLRHMLCRGWCLNRGMPRAATPENSSKGLRKHDFHFGTSYDLCTELYDHDYPSVKHVTKLNSIYLLTLQPFKPNMFYVFFPPGPQKKGPKSSHRTILPHLAMLQHHSWWLFDQSSCQVAKPDSRNQGLSIKVPNWSPEKWP